MGSLIGWLDFGQSGLIALLIGYALGSIPFGLVLTKLAGTEDIRTIGSGNIGATNVLRTGRKGLAVATLLLDGLKGTAAVLIAGHLFSPVAAMMAGFGAFLGHLFPVWLGFMGGKGVATYIGILFGLWWQGGLIFAGVWLAVAAATRYSSLAALVATTLAVPVALFWSGKIALLGLFVVLGILVIIKHKQNIQRLLDGSEGRIGGGKSSSATGT
jgi:acyl phosphate:glycerol-3-phosphate acyltransferase